MSTAEAFAAARAEGRAALVGYLPAGFPDTAGSIEALRTMVAEGCDVIEVGLPYSDPVMDGPTVQAAAQKALEAGFRTTDVLRTVEAVAATGVPTVVMTYWNPVERYGVDRFAKDLANAGGAGLITPDLVPDEAAGWVAAADEHGLDKVFLVAPSSTDARLRMTVESCRGFVYATAVMGVTGTRESSSGLAGPLVARTREVTDLPVGVGLGVSNGDQAAEIAGFADGVIVGSAFVRRVLEAGSDRAAGLASLAELTRDLADGVRRVRDALVALTAAAGLLLAGCSASGDPDGRPVANVSVHDDDGLHGIVLPRAYVAPKVPLEDTERASYDLATSPRAPLTLVFFGYSNCPDVCQVVMANLASALVRLTPAQRRKVQVVFVTTDPRRDTPARLRTWLDRFDPAFEGLTGPLPAVVRAGKAFGIPVERGTKLASGGYDVNHGTNVVGLRPDGTAPFVWTQGTAPSDLAGDVRKILDGTVRG